MRFYGYLTIPANTTFNNPAKQNVKLAAGIVTEIEIMFPAGSAGLAHFVIDHRGHQVWPLSPDQSFVGDDSSFTISDHYEISDAPYTVQLRGWSPGSSLAHSVYAQFTVSGPEPEAQAAIAKAPLPEGIEE